MQHDGFDPETLAIHGDGRGEGSDVAPPVHVSSTFRADSAEDFDRIARETRPERFYTRYGNPTVARVERVVAGLEGCEAGLLCASGMGAITTTLLSLLKAGDHVVAQRSHYMGTSRLLSEFLPRFGVSHTLVNQEDVGAFADAIRPETRVIVLETPSNPVLSVTDLAAFAGLARDREIVTLADNTFASPINQRPHALGVDLVVHSATKYLGGHSDLVAGIVCGDRDRLDVIWSQAIMLGASSNGFDAFLLLRGLRTLPLRVGRQNTTALALARFLETHPRVARVYYPGLESHPGHDLAARQMSGFGGVLSFEHGDGAEGARTFVERLRLVTNAVSLGGVESLVAHVGSMWEDGMDADRHASMTPGLVRLAVGLEHPDDLKRDLADALG